MEVPSNLHLHEGYFLNQVKQGTKHFVFASYAVSPFSQIYKIMAF